ncbi:hypothetical protein BDF20DRAFT_853975 [Mycotypha africana]|uniref:uncharacterized protein n=1 Tax=Mycotypha africana TaxID=64632 RepID=UPI002301C35D|nr:uncharacterized protein BDF20DRAFT_853975 [Mycotypha africana]KAI8988135.1 hypothetical protein BDF20DRAFT_853975 [Mycotypha africana]
MHTMKQISSFGMIRFLSLLLLLLLVVSSITVSAAPLDKRGISSCYKKARITQYWIPKEGDKDMTNDGKSVTLTGSKTKSLKDKKGRTIEKVAKITYEKFQMEGTGLLKSGKLVNLDSGNDKFMELDRSKTPYGLGSNGNGLQPWVSVAANDIKKGTTLYVKELDGLKLPDGKIHNGCVRVDDEGWSFDGCQLDFFVLQFTAYQELQDIIPDRVNAVEKKCTIKNYVTSAVKKWAVL